MPKQLSLIAAFLISLSLLSACAAPPKAKPFNIATFTCADHTSFTAAFYNNTNPATANVTYQGQSEVFAQTRTASGARYEGENGKYFWNKGREAMFRWNMDKPYVNCRVSASQR